MRLPKTYEPGHYESDIYDLWEQSGAFKPAGTGESYSIVMPPPNANANLHIGYELTAALEDIAARYHRLRGRRTLLVPGADHAGFETQSVYEKQLAKEGKSRFDFTREELYRQLFDFVAQNRANFSNQLRRMGVSCDWERFTFTLDDKIVQQAYKTFKKMWDEGLIYRGERLVNYCTFHGTAFADIEVEYKEEQGQLWFIRYPLTDGSGEVVVATTRPETMLGDTGVAVHPDDKRYAHIVDKTVKLPLTGREVPVVADDFVEQDFGTGAVKLTPAHDPNDYDAAARHALPKLSVIGRDGKMTHEVPEKYRGLDVLEARKAVAADLDAGGFLMKTEKLKHNVGHCYKCGTIIEPLLMDQWFVDMQPLAKPAIKALKEGKITFYPEAKQAQLINYLEGLRDWNISRQIAWGIPIPAFQNVDDPEDWVYDERVGEKLISVSDPSTGSGQEKTYRRDPDVFDTWFSSGSWPYATLGLGSTDFEQFYPLSLMETGGEILYPWVSRMIMLGLYITGEVPFKEVYIHGYVMAEDGSKMSKSVGNVVDPLPVIEQYGSDALRMGIVSGRAPAVNRGYDQRRVEEARNFCNKLWNVARYIESLLGDSPAGDITKDEPKPTTAADHWVLQQLQQTTEVITSHLDNYRFAEAYDALYHFVWDDFADWYIEVSKTQPNQGVLAYCLKAILTIAHPFAPFVTETIWQTLEWQKDSLLITHAWPKPMAWDGAQAADFAKVQAIVTEVRYIISSLKTAGATLYYSNAPIVATNAELIKRLTKLQGVAEVSSGQGLHLTQSGVNAWLDIDTETAKRFLQELDQKQAAQGRVVEQLQARLHNKSYVQHAPKSVVQQTRDQLAEAQKLLAGLAAEHERFSQL